MAVCSSLRRAIPSAIPSTIPSALRRAPERPTSPWDRSDDVAEPRDRGATLPEILVAIVLMGVVVVAVVTSISTIAVGGLVDKEHANTFEWLQAASDAVYRAPRVPCTSDGSGRLAAIADYDAAASTAARPSTFDGTSASISVTNVEYLGRTDPDADFEWSETFCFEGAGFAESPLYTQRVTIVVTPAGGGQPQHLEMVKSE